MQKLVTLLVRQQDSLWHAATLVDNQFVGVALDQYIDSAVDGAVGGRLANVNLPTGTTITIEVSVQVPEAPSV